MSNRDFSHTTRIHAKSNQTIYAGAVANAATVATTPGFIVKGGVGSASVATSVAAGAHAVGATVGPTVNTAISAAAQNSVARGVKTTASELYNIVAATRVTTKKI